MEKLQAALARAREMRENDGRPVRSSSVAEGRRGSRQAARQSAVDERWSNLPMMAADDNKLQASRIFAHTVTPDAQHFDILRTKLFLEMRKTGWTRIAVTSATPGCGKTTTACNMIAGLGRQLDLRGMLFDLDFRRPTISHLFGVQPGTSFKDVLLEEVPFHEQALRLTENTSISMTPKPVDDPSQVILRPQTAEILDRIQADYKPDIMLFDTPPVLVSDETRGFLKHVDAVLIVAGAETSSVAQVDEVEREVAQYSNVAGIVLNKCRFMDENYGYYNY